MSAPFKVGEIAIGQHFADFPEHNDEDLLVIEGARFGSHIDAMELVERTGVSYLVETISGEQFYCAPHHLRRKPPSTGEQSVMQMFVDAPQRVEVPA